MASDVMSDNFCDGDKYEGIVYKRDMTPDSEKSPAMLLQQNIAHHEVYAQHPERRVGNEEGFELLDMHKHVLGELAKVQKQIDTLREENSSIREENSSMRNQVNAVEEEVSSLRADRIMLRRGVLEERRTERGRQAKEAKTMDARNEIAHGGDIMGDMEAIRHVQKEGSLYVSQYKDGFAKAYDIQFSEALAKLPGFPQEAVRTFNVLASVRELNTWRQSERQTKKKAIQALTRSIIKAVLSTDMDDLPALFGENGKLTEEYAKMNRLFIAES